MGVHFFFTLCISTFFYIIKYIFTIHILRFKSVRKLLEYIMYLTYYFVNNLEEIN